MESSTEDIVQLVRPYARSVTEWFLAAAGSFGGTVLHLFLTIGIAAVLYAKGEMAAEWCRLFGRRLADKRGEEVVVLAGGAIRGVALGVVLTALAQTFATGIALTAAGVPQAGFCRPLPCFCALRRSALSLWFCRPSIWLFATGQTVPGIVLVVIGVPAVLMDNFLRPVLIRRGADLPLLLILGWRHWRSSRLRGTRSVLGPVILAVTYTLLQHWIADEENENDAMALSEEAGRRTSLSD